MGHQPPLYVDGRKINLLHKRKATVVLKLRKIPLIRIMSLGISYIKLEATFTSALTPCQNRDNFLPNQESRQEISWHPGLGRKKLRDMSVAGHWDPQCYGGSRHLSSLLRAASRQRIFPRSIFYITLQFLQLLVNIADQWPGPLCGLKKRWVVRRVIRKIITHYIWRRQIKKKVHHPLTLWLGPQWSAIDWGLNRGFITSQEANCTLRTRCG